MGIHGEGSEAGQRRKEVREYFTSENRGGDQNKKIKGVNAKGERIFPLGSGSILGTKRRDGKKRRQKGVEQAGNSKLRA